MHKSIVRMLSPLAAALFSLVMSLSAHAAAPTLSSPANNATVQLQNATQKAYFAKTPRADRWAYMDSDTGRKKEMIVATSRPEPVTFSWSGGTAPYTLTVKRVSDGATFALSNNISTTSVKLYNFEIGRKYSWTVKEKGGAESAARTFTTELDAPRFLRVGLANKDTFYASLTKSSGEVSAKANGSDFLPNFRDVGGVFTADRTQRMKQGLVFRSYEYDKYGSEWKPYGVDTDLVCGTGPGQLGIKTDIDLRSDLEVAAIVNTNNGKSPLNTTAHPVAWQHCAIAKYDAAQLGTPEKNALALIADASKYPLVFHCMCGQDRTGCLAIYIYSILGVDDETMLKSWEASSFFQGDNNWSDSDPGFRSYRIQGFIDSFRAYGTSSDTLAACVVKALKAKNVVTDTTIAQIRANLLETDEFCETPSSGGTLHATLSTDGVGYLETGYTPNLKTTKVELSFKQLTPSNGKNIGGYFVTGAGWTAKEQQLSLERYNSGNVGFLYNGCQTEWLKTAFTDTASSHTIWMCGNQAGLDSATLTATNALVSTAASGTLKIGCGYYEYPSGSGIRAGVPMAISSCKIYENGSVVREYVPAKTSAGVATLYDTKTKTFLTAVNAGGFTVGAKTGDIEGGDEPTPSDDPLPSAFDAAHTIVCWGDSLTFGRTAEASGETTTLGTLNNYFGGRLNGKTVAKSYPYYLAQQVDSSYNVIAQARSGMCADMILAWMGGTETKTTKSITVPKTGTVAVQNGFTFPGRPNDGRGTIAVSESSTFAGLVAPVYALHSTASELGASKIDKVITGKLGGTRVAVTGDDSTALTVKSLDTLSAAVTVAAGTTFVPDATRAPYKDAVHVIFVGTNDGAKNYSDVIAQVQNAVAKIPSGRYVVVSTHAADKNAQTGETLTPTAASTLERAYAAAFGNRHLNLRLALYAKDATWETDGKLASDDLHFTPAGYQLVAEIVKAKLDALGYLGGTPGPGPEPVTYEKTVSVDETVTKLDITTSGTLTLNNAKLKVTGKVAKYDAVPLPNGLAADLTVKFIGANAALEYTGESSWLAPGYPTNGLAAFTGSCTLDYTVPANGWRSATTAPLRAVGATDRVYFGKNVKFVIDATAVQPSAGETVKIYLASGTHAEGGVHFSDGYGFDVIKAASTVTVSTGMTYVFAAEKDAIVLSVTAPGTPVVDKKGFERAKQENRPPRVLVIGNSFTQGVSRDLQYNGQTIKEYRTHFPTAVRAMGETIDYCALYRGGSSIQQHYEHRETKGFFAEIDWSFDSAAPSWARNGEKKGMFWCDEDGKTKDNRESETPPSDTTPYHICLDDLLNAVDWDVIMIQESAEIVPFWNAPESEWIGVNTPECRRDYETGTPRVSYGEPLANYVAYLKAKRPNAELWLHQTWALPAETTCIDLGTKAKRDWMYNAINTNAMRVAELYGTKTVPTGYAVQLYRYQYSDSHNPDVTDPCSYDKRHINGGYSIYAERKIPEEQRYRTYLQMMTWCQRWYGKMPAVGTTPCEPSVAAELTAMREAALQAGNATEYWDYGQGGEQPSDVVRTVSTDTTEANLVFGGTAGKLILDNATLTVSGKLSNYVAYRFGEDATGALELSFAGAKAGLVHEQKSTAGMIGSTTATSEMLVRFTVPATPWTVAPLRATATDSKIRFQQNVKFAVDATAVANPGAGVTVTVPLAAGTAIDDDGVTPVGVSFDGVDFATVKARSTVTCADGVTGELVYENAALFVRLTGSGDTPTPESPITLTAPANGSTLALYTANQKKYFALTGEAIKTDYTSFDSSMTDAYLKLKATFAWFGASGAVTLKIVRAADQAPFLTKSLASGTKLLVVNNLEVGTAYTWSVEDAAGNRQTATFTTEAQAPRILYSQKVKSVRDLGGWTGLQGCRVKQGELIRTAEMDNFGAENRLSDDEIAFYRDVIGVRSDVDLRSDVTIRDEATQSVETTGRTPIPGATWYGCPVTGFGYQFPAPSEVAQLNTNFANFKKVFGYVLDATKRPLVFHCISGRDRTGTVAALTLALLGVSEDDIWREYRIAQDMTSADRFRIDEITGTLKTLYPAATLAASAKLYFTETLGFTSAQVEQFRTAMLPGYETEDPPVSTLALTAPADGATVALYTANQKKYFALTGEAIKTDYTSFDSSMRDRYLHPSVTLAWTGANGAVTVRVTRQGGRVLVSKELAAGTASLAVYNLEVGATYTWTVTDAEGASASAAFTTEDQAPRILNGDQIPSVRDLGGWVGLQGIRVKQGELVRTAHLDDESTGASLLTDTSRDTFLNVIGVKTELDFRSSSELEKIGRTSVSKLGETVTRYCYPIPSYALGDFVPGEDKPYGYFALAFQRVFDSGSRPLAFHCKIGRDRTGTFAAMILSLLGVSEDDIMREYRIAGDFSTSKYFHIDEVIALLKTEFPADTLAASAKRYFTEAVGFTADEVEQFREEMLPGYDREDPTPGEYVRTVSTDTTEKNLVFEGTAGKLILDNATLTVSGILETYVAYRFGEDATGALELSFAGEGAGLVHSTAASAGLIGSTTATSDMLVKFTVPATPWTVAPLRATATDSKIYFRKNVKFEVDAKAVVNPGPGETISVPLASGTAIDDDGVTPVGVLFDGVDFETVKQRSTVTCGDGVTGELVYEGSAFVLVLTGLGDVPKPTYYLVGTDAAGASSFVKSSSATVGWAETKGGAVIASHTVAAGNDYVIDDATMRTPTSGALTFAGDSLKLTNNGGILVKGEHASIAVSSLVIEGSGAIASGDAGKSYAFVGTTTVGEGATLGLTVMRPDAKADSSVGFSEIVGAGTLRLKATDDSKASAKTQTLTLNEAQDFTGTINAVDYTYGKRFILKVTGGFGGTVTSLPNGTEKVVFNYDGLDAAKGVVVADAATAVPEGLTTGLVLYSATADFTAANLPLVTFPAGVAVDPAAFTVKYAASVDGAATAFENLGLIANADGTQTLVANAAAEEPKLRPGEGEGEGKTEIEVTAEGEDEAVAKVAIVSPDESIVSSKVYAGYFTKSADPVPGESNRWLVSIELNKDVVKPDEVAAELAGKFDEVKDDRTVTLTGAKPGLWYSVKEGEDLGKELAEGERAQAVSDTVELPVTKFPTSGFYRVIVNAANKEVK